MAANNPFAAFSSVQQSSPFGQAATGQSASGPKSVFGAPSQPSPFAAAAKPSAAANPFGGGFNSGSSFGGASSTPGPTAPTQQPSLLNGVAPLSRQKGFATGSRAAITNGNKNGRNAGTPGASEFPPAKLGSVGGFPPAKLGSVGKWGPQLNGDGLAPTEATLARGIKNKKGKHSSDLQREKLRHAREVNDGTRDGAKAPQSAKLGAQDKGGNGSKQRSSKPTMALKRPSIRQPTEATRQNSQFAFDFANRLYEHLRKNNIKPPEWPADVGNPRNRAVAEKLKDGYKKYRDCTYTSLRKAEMIDDPEKRRRLEDALPFKGICENMCPEFEQVSRIAEYDVTMHEKVIKEDGSRWDEPALMVKKFGRSAAGQDAPLPMDVRSIDALRRTTNYLFDDLLQNDENLPVMHNFLWDRTRAVRRDFTFHSTKSNEEMKQMVYIYENITRFHAIAHHLLCRKGFGNEDFEPKQEIDQLGRTLLSLMEAYDVCRDRGVVCGNEPEFRAYWLLLNAHDASIISRIPSWGEQYWFGSPEIQTAWALINSMLDLREHWGPIKPRMPRTLTTTCFQNFLEMVKSPDVSYTMACIAEVHFTYVRQGLLKNLVKAYSRPRDAPRYITAQTANEILQFDTDDEAKEFIEEHGFEFSTWYPEGKTPVTKPYILLNDRRKHIASPRVRPSFSGTLVERKRNGQSLPYLIHNTVYEEVADVSGGESPQSDDGLFVNQHSPVDKMSRDRTDQVNGEVEETSQTKPLVNGILGAPQGNGSFSLSSPNTPVPAANVLSSNPTQAFGGTVTTSSSFGGAQFGSLNPSLSPAASSVTTHTTDLKTTNPFVTPSTPSPFVTKDNSVAASTPRAFASPFAGTAKTEQQGTTAFPRSSTPSILGKGHDQSPTITFSPAGLGTFLQGSNESAANITSTKTGVQFPSVAPTSSALGAIPATQQFSSPALVGSSFLNQTQAEKPRLWATFSSPSAPAILPEPTPSPAPAQASTLTRTPSTGIFGAQSPPGPGPSVLQKPLPGFPEAAQAAQAPQAPPLQSTVLSGEALGSTKDGKILPAGPSNVQPLASTASLTPSSPSGLSKSPALAGPADRDSQEQPTAKRRDCMGDFNKWFVLGDGGLLEQFTDALVQELVGEAYEQHVCESEERERKEDEERSMQEARQHQIWNLSVKFFYRWRNNARRLGMKRILREGKEKARNFRETQRALARQKQLDGEEAKRQAEAEARRRFQADGYRFSQLAQQGVERRLSAEQKLLASGIFSGFRDQKKAAQWVVDGHQDMGPMVSSPPIRRARVSDGSRGPRPLSQSMESDMAGRRPREGEKTRLLREKFLEGRSGRSVSGTSSSVVSGAQGATNFSKRRRSGDAWANSDHQGTTKRQAMGATTTRHWDLRASGLVPTPDGSWVHEAIAKRTEHSKNVVHGEGLAYKGDDDDDDLAVALLGSDARLHRRHAAEESVPKRKRDSAVDEDEEQERRTAPGPAVQRAYLDTHQDTEAMIAETQKKLRELNETLNRLDREDRPWLHEQMQLLQDRQPMWDEQ